MPKQFTDNSTAAFERALCLSDGSDEPVSTLHILIGLIQEEDGVAGRVLRAAFLCEDRIRTIAKELESAEGLTDTMQILSAHPDDKRMERLDQAISKVKESANVLEVLVETKEWLGNPFIRNSRGR